MESASLVPSAPTIDPSSSLSHLQWRATEFLLAFGPLTGATVMDYFVLSPFFDRSSNNAVMRMQMMYSRGGMEGVDEEAELKKFVGTEYVVVHAAAPSLFIIHKRDRKSPTEALAIAAYYVLNDNIYQGPTLFTVLNERILTSLHALTSSIELLRQHKPKWTAENLYTWSISCPSSLASPVFSKSQGDLAAILADVAGKRNRNQSVDGVVDEDSERPAEPFNPLLFRALKSLSASLISGVAPVQAVTTVEVAPEKVEEEKGIKEIKVASNKRVRQN